MNQELLRGNRKHTYFAVITREGMEKLKADDILYFESEGRKVHVHTKERRISFNGCMEEIRAKLDGRFFNCHGSYEINLTKVIRFNGSLIEMEGGKVLPVSQRRSAELRRSYQAYLRKHFPCNLGDDIV
ncbi:hypothetical protein MASR2M70_15210 [Bacillota bacterium]